MSKYTAKDFANARFAEHEDGRLAHRVEHGTVFAWSFEECGEDEYAANEYMAHHGWAPIPDQVPGRTITQSECRDTLNHAVKTSGYGDDWERGFFTGLTVGGTKVVPDPEPTNAESISKLLAEFAELNASCGGEQGDHDLAEFLNARGVKAGGDDE